MDENTMVNVVEEVVDNIEVADANNGLGVGGMVAVGGLLIAAGYGLYTAGKKVSKFVAGKIQQHKSKADGATVVETVDGEVVGESK